MTLSSLLLAVTVVAHEPGYFTSLANHLQRWLREESVPAEVVTPATMAKALAKEKIAFLVGFDAPDAAEMKVLKAYHDRGGKLVVFHSSSPALAALMDVKVVGYRTAPYAGAWSRIDFASPRLPGVPASLRQTSTVLQSALPVAGRGRVIATWSDRRGRPSGEAAWIATRSGFWMTHVLLADGDERLKAQLVAAMAGAVEPSLWTLAAHNARAKRIHDETRAYALRQVPRTGEIHAVWEHSGCGLYPGDWPKTIRILREARVTDLFVNVAGAGFAHYPSDILPRSKTYAQEGDQLAACLAAAKGSGIRVHAWLLCFTATRSSPERLAAFERRGWRLRKSAGGLSEYLDPSNKAVRDYLLSAVDELQAKYPALAGVHLDFVRWYEGAPRPKNAADVISRFVADARRRVKRPRWLTTAVLGKYPACVASVGQDWPGWIHANLVDYVVPMDYTENAARLESYLLQQAATKRAAAHTIVGLGVTANESRLDARQLLDEMRLVRKHPFAGVALFDLDATLEDTIFPYLKLGIW